MNTAWYRLLWAPSTESESLSMEPILSILSDLQNGRINPSQASSSEELYVLNSPLTSPDISSAPLSAELYPAIPPYSNLPAVNLANVDLNPDNPSQPIVTQAEVRQIIDERLDSLRIYVLESDITQAQQAVKSVVELASF